MLCKLCTTSFANQNGVVLQFMTRFPMDTKPFKWYTFTYIEHPHPLWHFPSQWLSVRVSAPWYWRLYICTSRPWNVVCCLSWVSAGSVSETRQPVAMKTDWMSDEGWLMSRYTWLTMTDFRSPCVVSLIAAPVHLVNRKYFLIHYLHQSRHFFKVCLYMLIHASICWFKLLNYQ